MADHDTYADCLRGSRHILTILEMMRQDGLDCVVVGGSTTTGLSFSAIVVVGDYSEALEDAGMRIRDAILEGRGKVADDGQRN